MSVVVAGPVAATHFACLMAIINLGMSAAITLSEAVRQMAFN